ncbi:hypothetical protein BLNAU_20843 [Blattamonas nauphoetae]|uniref:Uncharacterized protein n=1 Tax=Blattamonas nauphoetae TaxID=2049346 RepID=A0ABQ9WY46_9EUKA|nr:hypothetical protein BLNAU_20843 [Blattamonas nauphoetae]
MEQGQDTTMEVPRSVTPAIFQNPDVGSQTWNTINGNIPTIMFGAPLVANQAERAEDLKDTGRLLPHFEWEDEEVEELKTKMGQAPSDVKMYPDAISRRPWNREYLGNLNRSLYSLETESFHLFKLGTSALTNSTSTEDLARGIELMTLKSAELVKRVNDTRIEHILKIPVDGVGSAAKMESLTKQNERIDAAMVEAQKRRGQRRRTQRIDPLFFRDGPDRGHFQPQSPQHSRPSSQRSTYHQRQGQTHKFQPRRTQTPPRQTHQPFFRKGNQQY